MSYTVGEVATLAKVSVRTLHHYDEIGLLKPSARTEAGYRLYTEHDLETLQQTLFFRELGFDLADIRDMLSSPGFDAAEALQMQRDLLVRKRDRVELLIEAVDLAILARKGGVALDKEDMFEVFGDFDPAEYAEEAEQRWGDTDAYKESMRRTSRNTKEDWKRMGEESGAITTDLVALMQEGAPADDPRVQAVIERHWKSIDTNFYACSMEIYGGVGEMYVADPRFTKNIDKAGEGLALYMRDGIRVFVAGRR
ncbi:MerR family transcriptional regulator [bacterium]|nr:MerR family transcriptional regulator [bacterium]